MCELDLPLKSRDAGQLSLFHSDLILQWQGVNKRIFIDWSASEL